MLRSLVGSAIRFRLIVCAAAAALMFFGIQRVREIPLDVFPEFAPPLVEIQTEAPGLSTEEVDDLVTVPLENALSGSPGVATVRSKSVLGLSSIVLILSDGADPLRSRQVIQEKLANAARELPAVARPPTMLPPLSALSRVMKVGISSAEFDMVELSELVRWTVRPRLMGLPGVANVAVWGERERQLHVLVDPERLAAHGVTLDAVVEATRAATTLGAGGFLDTPNQRLAVFTDGGVRTSEDLARVLVDAHGLGPRRLGDVAAVEDGFAPLIGEGVINDGPGILLIVEKEPAANTLEVTRSVEAALAELAPALPGVDVDSTIFRPATFVEMSIANLSKALAIGVVLVAAVLLAFLFDWRTAAISMTAIPISMLVAVLVLDRLGGRLDTMILAGLVIALGEVVDDAIIDVENISRRLRLARASGAPYSVFRVVLEASLEVRSAVVYGSLIVGLVMLPVFFLEGLAGSFFRPLAAAYVLAILASTVTALTLTPALAYLFLRRSTGSGRPPPLVRFLSSLYSPFLASSLRRPALPACAAVALVLVTGWLAPRLGEDFMPKFKEYDFLMHWVEKPGTSIDASRRITERASRELRAIPGVRNFGAHIGRAVAADEVVGPNFTELWISVDPSVDYDETVARIQEVVDGYPGLYRDVLTYLKERVKEVLSGASASIVVRIFGPDLAVLGEQARRVAAGIADVPGVADLEIEQLVLVPQARVELDAGALERFGLGPGRVRDALTTLVRGRVVGEVFELQQVARVTVWGAPHVRGDVGALRDLRIDLPQGGQARLRDVARVDIAPTPNVIKREGGSRRIDVTCNVAGRDLASVAREVEQRVADLAFPAGYHPEVLGEYAAQREARTRLLSLAALSLIGIFVLLMTDFRSLRPSLLVFLGLPVALAGGVLAALASGGALSLGSFVGFVTVLGLAARNSIMLLDHCRYLELREGLEFGPALVQQAALERLAPILMTALTTGLALAPIVASGRVPGHEIEHPMAIVILGGLATSTFLSLLVLPGTYLSVGRGSARYAEALE